jgi:uncharacterized metal-binding protein
MVDLPKKKVGIISCSGEEMPEGTITRLAALKVLEELRPDATVTICLPLFLAGGEGDRAFAKFYPTIAIDGCEKRCAFRGTEMYSNQPASSIVVTELVTQNNLPKPEGKRKLSMAGMAAVNAIAYEVATQVDELLGKGWDRLEGSFINSKTNFDQKEQVAATCSCGSGIPIQKLMVNGVARELIALPLIFENFHASGKIPSEDVLIEMMEMVKIYNKIEPNEDTAIYQEINKQYRAYWQDHLESHE